MADIGQDIAKAVEILNAGTLVAIPTETVYGLAGSAISEKAILEIYRVKNRPSFDPLIAHVDAIEKLQPFVAGIPEKAMELAEHFWPGPLTLLLTKTGLLPDILTSGLEQVAVRVPNHPMALAVLEKLDYPLAAPSANPFGYVSPTTAQHVNDQLGNQIEYILDGGACEIGLESTIVGFEEDQPVVYRLGGTKLEELEKVVGKLEINANISSNPAAPGMLKSHYSPGKKMIIGDVEKELASLDPRHTGIISFQRSYPVPDDQQFILSPLGNLDEAARNIFQALRSMDRPEISTILTEFVPDKGLGRAINDRLKRAAAE